MNTDEFIERVKSKTNYKVEVSEYDIEISDGIAMICTIKVGVGVVKFYEDNYMDLDNLDQTILLSLIHEYSLTDNREKPSSDVTISKSEYQYLNEKAERLDKLESVLNDKSEYELPF